MRIPVVPDTRIAFPLVAFKLPPSQEALDHWLKVALERAPTTEEYSAGLHEILTAAIKDGSGILWVNEGDTDYTILSIDFP